MKLININLKPACKFSVRLELYDSSITEGLDFDHCLVFLKGHDVSETWFISALKWKGGEDLFSRVH
jgi:hypothetical protein